MTADYADSVYRVAIIGAGPGGLSAAGRAAMKDQKAGQVSPTHILLEAFDAHAKTIQKYQKGKHVMAEPGYLDLRSDFHFAAGTRESVLHDWQENLLEFGINCRTGAEVVAVSGVKGNFVVSLKGGETLRAEHIVLAIGLEGNPRKLGVPGEDLERVQYHLDDPREYKDERIVVVGAGDSAIENAIGLCEQNDVWILNRKDEFSRAKEGNLNAILSSISDPNIRLHCHYSTTISKIDETGETSLDVTLETSTGEIVLRCDRVIARLGAIPPRRFVESMGIKFPSKDRSALPELTASYESNVPGIYVIGSLAGYPLIKQAMNQGYDVIEYIDGNNLKPADFPLLEYQFHGLPFERSPDDLIARWQQLIPMFSKLNPLAFRELIIESNLIAAYPAGELLDDARSDMAALERTLADRDNKPRRTKVIAEGDVIYRAGEGGFSFFTIVAGQVELHGVGNSEGVVTTLERGRFFGEMSLLSGRPRFETAIAGPGCIVFETPRRTMLKQINSNESVKAGIDWVFVARELQRQFVPRAMIPELRDIIPRVRINAFKAGAVLYEEEDPAESLHIIRSGSVSLFKGLDAPGTNIAQVQSGEIVGQMALLGDPVRRETAKANVATETIEVRGPEFMELMRRKDASLEPLRAVTSRRVTDKARREVRPEVGSAMDFLMAEGLGEATNVLVIDEGLCIGCDNCEKACAETHDGLTRLDRKTGPSFGNLHIPISCRHCEQPHCMKDCPPNAIHRAANGEVFIDDSCIGCGNCVVNCPYDVIRMEYDAPRKPGLLQWVLFGRGSGPGEEPDFQPDNASLETGKKAKKCDACMGYDNPACVVACPTGAALRIGPDRYIDLVEERRR